MHKNEFSKKRNISFAINAIKITPTTLTEPNVVITPSSPTSNPTKPFPHHHTRNIRIKIKPPDNSIYTNNLTKTNTTFFNSNTTFHNKSFANPTPSSTKALNTNNTQQQHANTHSHSNLKPTRKKPPLSKPKRSPSKLLFSANQKLLNRIYKIPKTLSTQLNNLKKQKQHLNLKQYQDKLFLIAAPQLSKDLRCKLDKSFYKLRRRNDKQYDNNYMYIKHIESMEQAICNKINYKERMLKTFLIENNYVKPLSLEKRTSKGSNSNSNGNSNHNRTHSNYYHSHTKKIMELPQLKIRRVIMNAASCVHDNKKQLTQRHSSVKINTNNNIK